MSAIESKPVVFACAGCSAAGRLAYDLALEFDRRQTAEMSCLAGLAAELKPFTRLVKGRPVWVVDGCPIGCAGAIFARLGRPIDYHIHLDEYGVRKKTGLPREIDLEALADRVAGCAPLPASSLKTHDDGKQHNSAE
jgi:uncharacterized metal-binding protein